MTKLPILAAACAGLMFMAISNGLAQDNKPVAKIKPYPLKVCLVSGEKLTAMGAPVAITNGNREIKFCCKSCLSDFKKDPDKYLKKLKAIETQSTNAVAPAASEPKHSH
jgi:YHS domain-containing protein